MAQLEKAQIEQLKALLRQFKLVHRELEAIQQKKRLRGPSSWRARARNCRTHSGRNSRTHTSGWRDRAQAGSESARAGEAVVHDCEGVASLQGGKFLKTHPSEDLETALKALEIAEGLLEEVAERYE
jgi:hypothetical protein